MGGKAKWRKLKRVVGPMPQGSQVAPAKQHFKKERTKTRDAKRRRMGDGGEEEDEEDAAGDDFKKEPKPPKDSLVRSTSKRGQEPYKSCVQEPSESEEKPTDVDKVDDEDEIEPETDDSLQNKMPDYIQEANGLEEVPRVLVTDLDMDFYAPFTNELEKPKSEDWLKEEIREATEEELKTEGIEDIEIVDQFRIDTFGNPIDETAKELSQKSTQTDAVNINSIDKPVKFFISDDSDSDTAIFVDANQGALNGTNGEPQENEVVIPLGEADIAINAIIDVGGESTLELTVEGQDIEVGIEEATRSHTLGGETIDVESDFDTQLVDVEKRNSQKINTEQRTQFLPSLTQHVKTETQKMHGNSWRHGQSRLPFEPFGEGDNVSRSSASDSVDTASITRSSVSDFADQDNTSKTSTNESVDQDGQRKCSTSESVDLDTTSVTSESIEHETVSKVSITESAEQETLTISESADYGNKMSTFESIDRGTISKSSTRGSISASESAEPDATSRTSVSESVEGHSKTSYSEYEEAEGITRTSASESGEQDSTSRTSVSESVEYDGTSRTSFSESAEEQSKTSTSVTGTSTSATGEYVTSKSSVSYSSEFDAESLSSTADLLTPKEEVSVTGDGRADQTADDSSKIEKESPTLTCDTQEKNLDRPFSPAWVELNLEDSMQLTEEGVFSEEFSPKDDNKETEADAESLFFSLYPEYQPGEIDENPDVQKDDTTGNPNVLCFRGQTKEQNDSQEEVYMAAEKSRIKEGGNESSNSGENCQFQHKLSTKKKFEREDKEVTESEGPTTQQGRVNLFKQQGSEGRQSEGGSELSLDSPRWKSLSDVPDSTSSSSFTQTADAKKTEHTFSKTADDLVCLAGRLGEGPDRLENIAEVVASNVVELTQTDMNPSQSNPEVGQDAMEGENKLEGNAKDRKTLVGKARDWIKGVTRMGTRKEDAYSKVSDKSDTKKKEADSRDEAAASTDQPWYKTEQEYKPPGRVNVYEERQNDENYSMVIKEKLPSDEPTLKTDIAESIYKIESKVEFMDTLEGNEETDATKDFQRDKYYDDQEERPEVTESEIREEGLFDIVGPEEELSDAVFKEDTAEEAGKSKDSDDTEVPEEENTDSPYKFYLSEAVVSTEQSRVTTELENIEGDKKWVTELGEDREIQTEYKYLDIEETENKENEAQFVSAEEGTETEVVPVLHEAKDEVLQDNEEKRRKRNKDEKSRHKRNSKSKSKSPHAEGEKEEKTHRKEREGKSGSKKRRHRKRTKSQEEPVKTSEEPRPQDIPLPPDDFENEPSPERRPRGDMTASARKAVTDEVLTEATPDVEKKKMSSKSREERKHSKKSDEKSGDATSTGHKRHSRSKREKSSESKKDKERLEKDTQKTSEMFESPREKLQSEGDIQSSTWSPHIERKDRKSSRKSSERKRDSHSTDRPKASKENKDDREHPLSEKASDEVCDDGLAKKSPRPHKKKPKKPPELSLIITESRNDTPIPSPKSLPRDFKLGVDRSRKSKERRQEMLPTGSQPLLQTLTFPPGVSKPLSPLPPTKELKFPPGVSKPLSPKPPTKELTFPPGVSKPLSPRPPTKESKFSPEVSKPLSPQLLTTELTFPPGVSKPLSPQPPKTELKFPPGVSKPLSPQPQTKELKFPPGVSKPLSPQPPMKELKFPPGVSKPLSPQPLTKELKFPPGVSKATTHQKPEEDLKFTSGVSKPIIPPKPPEEPKFPPGVSKPVTPQKPPEEPKFPPGVSKPVTPQKPPEELKFPPGISKPITPQPSTKDLKLQPEVTEPQSSLAMDNHKPKPIPEPLDLKSESELIKPPSPLKSLKFPEGIKKPISPRAINISKATPKTVTSSTEGEGNQYPAELDESEKSLPYSATQDEGEKPLPDSAKPEDSENDENDTLLSSTAKPAESQKPLPYPAKPVSPLKMLHFPEGISPPDSPSSEKPMRSTFINISSAVQDSLPDINDNDIDIKIDNVEAESSVTKESEVSKIASTVIKKPRPRIIIPKPEAALSQTIPTSSETTKPTPPLKFPVGVSKPMSAKSQKFQKPIFTSAEKKENLSPEPHSVPDSTKKDLPMRVAAKLVSPLKDIKFPEEISKPHSPQPDKDTKPSCEPTPTLPTGLEIYKDDDDKISDSRVSQEKKMDKIEPIPSVAQISSQGSETRIVLTFPESVSKPKSPQPQKTKFFEVTQFPTNPAYSAFHKANNSVDNPLSPPSKIHEEIKQPLIPSDFFKTVHPGEKPPSLLRNKTSSPAKEMLKTSAEKDNTKINSPGYSSSFTTFKVPEEVSKPLSPLPSKGKTTEPLSQIQREQIDSSIPVTPSKDRHADTIFNFANISMSTEVTKVCNPESPNFQKGRISEPISPSPVKIKHTVDFPSDVFPCTKATSPLIKPSSPKAIPSPKMNVSTTHVSSAVMRDASPFPKIPSPLTKMPPTVTKHEDFTAPEGLPSCESSGPKTEPKIPKSILSSKLMIPHDVTSSPEKSPRTPSETKSTISQTHLTYSEVSKRFTPSPRLPDEMHKEITATPPMTPPPEPECHYSATSAPKEKPRKTSTTTMQTSEVRSAARYSRGEAKSIKNSPSKEAGVDTKGRSDSTSENTALHYSKSEVSTARRHRDSHHGESESPSSKEHAQLQRTGSDSSSKKSRRRKRR